MSTTADPYSESAPDASSQTDDSDVDAPDSRLKKLQTKLKGTIHKVSRKVKEANRKLITGDGQKRVRDFVKEVPVVRMIDRVSFFLGVVAFAATEYVLVAMPQKFQAWFLLIMPILLLVRVPRYTNLKYKYFLFDFCYFTNALCLASILIPTSAFLRRLVFAFASGPVAAAMIVWRNSLVFHSLDTITSLYLHYFPLLLVYCWRWSATSDELVVMCPNGEEDCALDLQGWITYPISGYLVWQALYLVKTEYVDSWQLAADPQLWTSARWLTRHPNAMKTIAIKICRALRIMRSDEELNSEEWKTKLIFVASQLVFTLLTLAPVRLFWQSQVFHTAWLIVCLLTSIWNGATFYIDVFSSTYQSLRKNKQ